MKINNFDKFILIGIIITTLINIWSNHISEKFPTFKLIVTILFCVLICIWLVFFILRKSINYLTSGMYAVEAFILDENNNLLLINHPFHKKLIPPGGRISRLEFPNEGLKNRLDERIGLKASDYYFDPIIHELNSSKIIGKIEKIPAPFIVQKEKRKQRRYVKFHYDFIYVLRIKNSSLDFKDNDYSPIWVDLQSLKEIHDTGETFPDVLDTYKLILTKFN